VWTVADDTTVAAVAVRCRADDDGGGGDCRKYGLLSPIARRFMFLVRRPQIMPTVNIAVLYINNYITHACLSSI